MTTALDTNVVVALWNQEEAVSATARNAIVAAKKKGPIVISGAVYAELLALPGRTEESLDQFLLDIEVRVDWRFGEEDWRLAGRALQQLVARRKRVPGVAPRRILADFVIGTHAMARGHQLLTFDRRHYRAAFPGLPTLSANDIR